MSTVSYCILSIRYFQAECCLNLFMNTNINISTTKFGNVWCGSRFMSINRHNLLILQCYAEFICKSSTIVLKFKPGCAWIFAKLVSDKLNVVNTKNIHLIFVKLFKGDGLVEQFLNKFVVFFYFWRNMFFTLSPFSCHDRASFILFQPVQCHEHIMKDEMRVLFTKSWKRG